MAVLYGISRLTYLDTENHGGRSVRITEAKYATIRNLLIGRFDGAYADVDSVKLIIHSPLEEVFKKMLPIFYKFNLTFKFTNPDQIAVHDGREGWTVHRHVVDGRMMSVMSQETCKDASFCYRWVLDGEDRKSVV